MKNCDHLVKADCVFTQDDHRRVFSPGAVAVDRGLIAAVGPRDEIAAGHDAREVIDMGRSLVMPGLVNSHTHASMTAFRGLADDLTLMDWLSEHIWPVERELTPEMVHAGALLACAEMIRTGTTCFSDMYLREHEVARAVEASGMRAVLSEGVIQFPTLTYATMEQGWELIRGFVEHYRDHPRISGAIMAHAVYSGSSEMLVQSYELAGEYGLRWMIHAAESPQETAMCLQAQGLRPVAYLDSLGLLGPSSTLFHLVDVDQDEIGLLARRGVAGVHCPESNMKLANGFAPVTRLLEAGVVCGLGTDGAASNNDLNMFTEMASAALLQKVHLGDATVLDAQTTLDMATRHGATCLGLDDVGCLAPGRRADLVALDLTSPNLMPMFSPASHLVYAATGLENRLTMVEGRILYRDGSFETIDHAALVEEADAMRRFVLERIKG